jgi:hypothetical protein
MGTTRSSFLNSCEGVGRSCIPSYYQKSLFDQDEGWERSTTVPCISRWSTETRSRTVLSSHNFKRIFRAPIPDIVCCLVTVRTFCAPRACLPAYQYGSLSQV